MVITFLGTSDSQGVPRLLCDCEVCSKCEPPHVRSRPSIALQSDAGDDLLVDVGPDFYQQFLRHNRGVIPATVLITHLHNDHIGGLGDFADLCFWHGSPARIISPPEMIAGLERRFPYLGAARKIEFVAQEGMEWSGWHISFHRVNHGVNGYAYAIRFQRAEYCWVYMPDAFQATIEQLTPLRQADLVIMGASEWYDDSDASMHRAMYDVQEALQLKEALRINEMVLTHLSHNIDIPLHESQLPKEAYFAREGMKLSLPF